MTETLVLLDNTVLSNFARVRGAALAIQACPGLACTTEDALAEYLDAPEEEGLDADAWCDLPVIVLTIDEKRVAGTLPASLGAGERSCLAVALARRSILATDDMHARRLATRLAAKTTGTIGLLVMAVECGNASLEFANALLDAMIAAGYRSPVRSLDTFLRSSN